MILDARLSHGADRGVLLDKDTRREIDDVCWANTDTGEYICYVKDKYGRRVFQAKFEDLRTGKKEWVVIGHDHDPAAADKAAPAKGLLRVSKVYPVYRKGRARLEWIREPRG